MAGAEECWSAAARVQDCNARDVAITLRTMATTSKGSPVPQVAVLGSGTDAGQLQQAECRQHAVGHDCHWLGLIYGLWLAVLGSGGKAA